MGYLQILFIGIGLSMDATAVSISKGLQMKKIDKKYTLIIAAYFGIFQALMPLIGWLAGSQFEQYVASWAPWIAFILLAILGIKMIIEALKDDEKETENLSETNYNHKELLILAIATSIDALAVGVTFAFLQVNIWTSIVIIGLTTFILAIIGVLTGNHFGIRYKSKAEVTGGIILLIIGLKIILEHLLS